MERKKRKTGNRYKKYVLQRLFQKGKWEAKCDCGKIFLIRSSLIGKQISCGCAKIQENEKYLQDTKKRLLDKVKKRNGCWEWQGSRGKLGYGQTSYRSKQMLAHRLSWIIFTGEMPGKNKVCHTCDNPACINPKHLFLGSQSKNMKDMFSKNRKSHQNEKHPRAKLSWDVIEEIRKEAQKRKISRKCLAEKFSISINYLLKILNHTVWSEV